jgi:hypothetical protein
MSYGNITTPKKAKVYQNRPDWAEVVDFTDDNNYNLLYYKEDDGECSRPYMSEEELVAHLTKFNGLYEEVRVNGELTIHQNGKLIQKGERTSEGTTNSRFDLVICACLNALIGEGFSGYRHNYEIRDNLVYDEDE